MESEDVSKERKEDKEVSETSTSNIKEKSLRQASTKNAEKCSKSEEVIKPTQSISVIYSRCTTDIPLSSASSQTKPSTQPCEKKYSQELEFTASIQHDPKHSTAKTTTTTLLLPTTHDLPQFQTSTPDLKISGTESIITTLDTTLKSQMLWHTIKDTLDTARTTLSLPGNCYTVGTPESLVETDIEKTLAESKTQSQTPSSTLTNVQDDHPVVITVTKTRSFDLISSDLSSLHSGLGMPAPTSSHFTSSTNLEPADNPAVTQVVRHPKTISSSPPISPTEMNFFRLAFLILRRGSIAVRTYFDSKHPPLDLSSHLAANKPALLAIKGSRKAISTQQWKILYPSSGYVTSRHFDVSTLILLLRFMTNVPAPATGFDKLPPQTDDSVGADLARIKHYRNLVAHSKNAKLSEIDFSEYWTDIENAIGRLGGNVQLLEARTLKTFPLESKDNEILLEMRQIIFELQDTIPRNIKVQISDKVELWRIDDAKFYKTRATTKVLNLVQSKKCVAVVGNAGTGKSAILQHVALLMQDSGFHVVPIKIPHELIQYFDDSSKQLFIIDDPCGEKCIDFHLAKEWKRYENDILHCLSKNRKTRILISCRLSLSKTHHYKDIQLFKGSEVNLNSENYSLTIKEKKEIYKLHTKVEFRFKDYLLNLHDCFPLLCKLISTNKRFMNNPESFLKFPYKEYEKELDALRQHSTPYEYTALILCVMFDNEIHPEHFIKGKDQNIDEIFDVVFDECYLDQGTSRKRIKQAFETMTNIFVTKEDNCYELLHATLIEIVACHFAKQSLGTLITCAPMWILESRLTLPENSSSSECDNDTFIKLENQFKHVFVERITKELKENNIPDILFSRMFPNSELEVMVFHNLEASGELSLFLESNHSIKCAEIPLKEELMKERWENAQNIFFLVDALAEEDNAASMFHDIMKSSGMITSLSPSKLLIEDHHRRLEMRSSENTDDLFREWAYRFPLPEMFYERVTARQLLSTAETDFLHWLIGAGWNDFFQKALDYVDKKVIDGLLLSRKSAFILSLFSGSLRMVRFCAEMFHSDFKTNSFCFLCKQMYDADSHVENSCPLKGLTFIIVPCLKGNKEVLHYLLQEGICNLDDLNKSVDLGMDSVTPLTVACRFGYTGIVNFLIENGASVNCTDKFGNTPLAESCEKGYDEIVKILVNNGADLEKECPLDMFNYVCNSDYFEDDYDDGWPPLWWACYLGNTETVSYLLEKGAVADDIDGPEKTPLWAAIRSGKIDVLKLLIKKGARINERDREGRTPVWWASSMGREAVVKHLISLDVSINQCDNNGKSPLYTACYREHVSVAKMLINHGAKVNFEDNMSPSALLAACCSKNKDLVSLLVKSGADVNFLFEEFLSPISVTTWSLFEDGLTFLIDNGANLNINLKHGRTILMQIIFGDSDFERRIPYILHDIPCIEEVYFRFRPKDFEESELPRIASLLIQHGSDPHAHDDYGLTALMGAAQYDKECTELLLKCGVCVNETDKHFRSALHHACAVQCFKTIALLLEYGADINGKDSSGFTPLHYACENFDEQAIGVLLSSGADTNVIDKQGFTPLLLMLYRRAFGSERSKDNSKDVMSRAIKKQGVFHPLFALASIDKTNTSSECSSSCLIAIVLNLLEHGAEVNACALEFSALQLAYLLKDDKLVETLLQKGANNITTA